jgi:tRNA G37 N-methylase TrmD
MVAFMHYVIIQLRGHYPGNEQRWRRRLNIGITVLLCGGIAAVFLYGALIGDRIPLP